MKHSGLLCILVFGWLSISAWGQSPVSAAADRNRLLIGEQVQIYLKAVVPRGRAVKWPVFDTFPHFEVLQRSALDSTVTGQGILLQQTITITSWDSGHWTLPELNLPGGRTQPLSMDVGYSPMNPDQPYHDIKDILAVTRPASSNWYWYLVGIAVLIALFMLFFPPNEKKEKKEEVEEDVFTASMQRIRKLKPSDEPRALYTELTQIFRYYLEKRKGINSLSQTTGDLAGQLKSLSLPASLYAELVQALQLSDFVKFAKYQPTSDDNSKAIDIIQESIQTIEKH